LNVATYLGVPDDELGGGVGVLELEERGQVHRAVPRHLFERFFEIQKRIVGIRFEEGV
jgi:hypothetical protein